MRQVKSCGFLVMRREPEISFLLMQHPNRWDLPKGHVDPGEDELQCAYRELWEETGIQEADLQRDEAFRFTLEYPVVDREYPQETAHKTLVIFLGWLGKDVPIKVTEHDSYQWFPWNPPHQVQATTIDPLLAAATEFLSGRDLSA
ncbi:MAG: NUDIX domain-containing protein [Planctomycetota bacterium]|nr:NUDIX domain-containing protein [Planctomycetota bacterium]